MKTFLLALALLVMPAVSSGYSGDELLEICGTQEDDPVSTGLCTGYINGVVNGFSLMANYSAYNALEALDIPEEEYEKHFTEYFVLFLGFCPPENGVGEEQLEALVLRYLKTHPEERNLPSELLIHMALIERYPCEEPSSDAISPPE